jgi:hypothetical protein
LCSTKTLETIIFGFDVCARAPPVPKTNSAMSRVKEVKNLMIIGFS